MTTEHDPADTVWGTPQAAPNPWGLRETLMAVGIAAAIAGLGGAAVYATTGNTSSHVMGPPPLPPGADGGPQAGAFGPGGTGHGRQHGPPVHGQVVVADGAGGFVTMMSQSGIITATTPDSLTVRSEDGFTQTWATSAGQGSKFDVDDSVMVQGEQSGAAATPTVTEIIDPTRSPLSAAPGGL
ncbi:hypothetical protein [Mycolicibacterium iranicum]|uniref:DUF5666 domain-containing protein n=1 Tax=Mycolicibacterium iranicum TaxID=912594 RepID=A0A178LRT9_MYCIR|nr:hypothetical protein [Mycolicibacterium iranicum]OAN34961.1 hypothetical protein A4X20_26670 [Mycolicibacterium iranicum]